MLKHAVMFGLLIGAIFSVPTVYIKNAQAINAWYYGAKTKAAAYNVEPLKPASSRLPLRGGAVSIPMDQNGHFHTAFNINGRKMNALIDTGATYVALNRSMARRLGVNVSAQDMIHSVTTANGKTPAATVTLNEITIGKIRVKNVQALVLEDRALDGMLMGMSFLKELSRFSIEGETLILVQ